MFYVYLFILWLFGLWAAGSSVDDIFHAYNYQSFPGSSIFMGPGLVGVTMLFIILTINLIRIGRKHYSKTKQKKAALQAAQEVPAVPVQENK